VTVTQPTKERIVSEDPKFFVRMESDKDDQDLPSRWKIALLIGLTPLWAAIVILTELWCRWKERKNAVRPIISTAIMVTVSVFFGVHGHWFATMLVLWLVPITVMLLKKVDHFQAFQKS